MSIGQHKSKLSAPCLVIDKTKLITNIETMQNFAKQHHIQVRPHVKTHKCIPICQQQIIAGSVGICAAKVAEAEVLVQYQIPGILITSPVVTLEKIERLMWCVERSPDLMVVIDHQDNAQALNTMAQHRNVTLNVIIDINSGIGRTGVEFDAVLPLATYLKTLPQLKLRGIQCYAGFLQHVTDYNERRQLSQAIMQKAAQVRQQLVAAGFCCDILTGSGTGTYDIDSEVVGVTEVQPGSYTVMDVEYRNIHMNAQQELLTRYAPAMTLLTSVISVNQKTHVTVDAGLKALYREAVKPVIISHPGLQYDWNGFGDEHGKVTADPGVALPQLGEQLELIVPHCDPTINLFDQFYITENDIVVDCWPIAMRGKSQ